MTTSLHEKLIQSWTSLTPRISSYGNHNIVADDDNVANVEDVWNW
jgi:hypothetical protein